MPLKYQAFKNTMENGAFGANAPFSIFSNGAFAHYEQMLHFR